MLRQADPDTHIKRPLDADGVPINVGDVVTAKLLFGGTSEPLVVDRMELSRGKDGYLWMIALDTDKSCFNLPDTLRHYYAPTVEDVLREFADEVWNRYCNGTTASDSSIRELEAGYATKLRLVGDE